MGHSLSPAKATLLVFSFFIFSIIFSITTLGFSFTQITDNDLIITKGSCSKFQVPFKIVFTPNPEVTAECSWTLTSSFVRIFLQFIIIATILALFITFKRKNNKYFLMFTLFLGLVGIASTYSFITDSISVSKAILFCNSDLVYFYGPDGSQDTADKECIFERFYATIAFNILTTVAIFISTVLAFKKRSTIFNNRNNNQAPSSPPNQYSNLI